ncbi:MAG: UvrD-helicase domain-containing protein [Alphaproteobacteria bacterium]|nr:UvrD-helicase domain-containing protein [Alphaproteobacteria bacterium]
MDDIFNLDESSAAPVYNNTAALMPTFSWLDQLNPEQKLAVQTTEGPVLVLSGAGTGKTKVLTTRLAYILANMKANPWNCLVVTFTNRAAREMKERVHKMIGDMANSVWLGTFHSICVKILRNHAELAGLHSNFTILDTDDQKRVVKQICETMGVDDKKYPPQAIIDRIQRWKDKGLTVEKLQGEYKSNVLTEVYQRYQQRLLELNCVDFGDILLYALNILLSNPDILANYQNRFKYIMVDEYQDTNVTQYLFLRLLSQTHKNLCCVGDDDQSIYSWRGAEIENILRFEKDFPECQTIRLERNYRSTANILAAASCLISHNSGRLGKTLKVAENSPAMNCDNSKIKVVSVYSGEDEAKYVVEEIENLRRNGNDYSQMAVLVRTAFQTREFEEKFMAEAIPYQVIGGQKFYERAEIRDALAYFRVVLQPHDDLALERIINKPARGVGAKALEKLRETARSNGISLYMAAEKMVADGTLTGKAKTGLADLTDKFNQWRQALQAVTPDDLADQILDDSGYRDMLKQENTEEARGRLENLKELVNVLSDREKYPSLAEFMEHVSLVMDKDDALDPNKVMLITLHSAKGLEFDIVFLPGWEEGLFPHQRSLDEGGTTALEEERRLAYVAITRAKQQLYILTALNRKVYGQWQNNIPSRFINELPPSNIDIQNNVNNFYSSNYGGNYGNNYDSGSSYRPWYTKKKESAAREYNDSNRYSYTPEPEYRSSPSNGIVGVRVYHQSFGYGKIIAVDGNKLEIMFDQYGHKKLHKDYVTKA